MQTNIKEYAAKSKAEFIELLNRVVDNCPELLSDPLAREDAIGRIKDMCDGIFGLITEEDECDTSSYSYAALAKDESTYRPVGGRA